jgi:DNA-binding response OmpR family regulator
MEDDLPAGAGSLEGLAVLVVEDDAEIAELVEAYMTREGAAVRRAASAEEAEAMAALVPPALVILDLGLPGADGLEFLRHFRRSSAAPVIIVSARESDEDKIIGLGLGADDFVAKPFSPRVLVARAKAQARRSALAGGIDPQPPRDFGPFRLDMAGKRLLRGSADISLSKREFELLAFLASRPGRAFSAQELFASVWGRQYGDVSTVAVHVQRLRRKIEDDPGRPRWIRTVPGSGYRFDPEEGL